MPRSQQTRQLAIWYAKQIWALSMQNLHMLVYINIQFVIFNFACTFAGSDEIELRVMCQGICALSDWYV